MTAPYTIHNPDETRHGEPLGFVTSALTGVVWATYRDGAQLPIGVPLCGGCDEMVTDEPCSCETPATAEELARFYAGYPEMAAMFAADARRAA